MGNNHGQANSYINTRHGKYFYPGKLVTPDKRVFAKRNLQRTNSSFDYNESFVSLVTHSQSRLDSFQTAKTLCLASPEQLDFISVLCCSLFFFSRLVKSYVFFSLIIVVCGQSSAKWRKQPRKK